MDTKELVPRDVGIQLSPGEVVAGATEQAKLLMTIVKQTKCYQQIGGKMYLQVEAWETIGAFNQTHAETESIAPIKKDDKTIGYQARVQLWKNGVVVGGAIMPCYFTENCCRGKEGDAKHKASMSAAQTFATSKAYRMNFSYVAILAGFQPLPADEVTDDMKQPVDKTQHWCKEHDTQFFKKGKMKSYAHPVEGTTQWCYEHKEKAEPDIEQAEKDAEELFPSDPIHAREAAQVKQPKPKEPPPEADSKPTEVIKSEAIALAKGEALPTSIIDLDWVREKLKELVDKGQASFSEESMLRYMKVSYKDVKGGTVAEIAANLKAGPAKHLADVIQTALNKA